MKEYLFQHNPPAGFQFFNLVRREMLKVGSLSLLALGGLGFAQGTTTSPTAKPKQSDLALCAVLYKAGRFESALKPCERAAKANPSAEIVDFLARTQSELGRFTSAIENFKLAIHTDSSFVQSYVGLARVYIRQYLTAEDREAAKGYLDQAIGALREAEQVNSKYAPTFATRALVQTYQQKYDFATESYKKSLALTDEPGVRANLGDLYARSGNVDEALRQYDLVIKSSPKEVSFRIRYGSLLLLSGDVAKAVVQLDTAVDLRPGNAEAWYRRGDAYFIKKDWNQAGVSYSQAVALAPARYPGAYLGLGRTYFELGDGKKAKFNLSKAVVLDSESPEAHYWLGRSNEMLGDKKGAVAQCGLTVKLFPNYPDAAECVSRNK